MTSAFANTETASLQRAIRAAIRKDKGNAMTRTEREILVVLCNLWFYHNTRPGAVIHPGRAMLARKANCHPDTVSVALAKFRASGFMAPMAYHRGGNGCATEYVVDIRRILQVLDPSGVVQVSGKLSEFALIGLGFPNVFPKVEPSENPKPSYRANGPALRDA